MTARLSLALFVIILCACSPREETGPGRVRWDRDVCARCAMAISDRHFAAQVRGGPADKRSKLHLFDDLGCAVIWLGERPWRDDPRTELWVTDHRDGTWLSARSAGYVAGQITPMDYGLGAVPPGTPGAMDYEAAVAHILARRADR